MQLVSGDLIEVSKVESAITAVLAGFAISIAIFLLQTSSTNPTSNSDQPLISTIKEKDGTRVITKTDGEHTTSFFFVAFFAGILSSISFAVISGLTSSDLRVQIMFTAAVFNFALCAVMLICGLFVAAVHFQQLKLADYAKNLIGCTLALAVFYVASTAQDNAISLLTATETAASVSNKPVKPTKLTVGKKNASISPSVGKKAKSDKQVAEAKTIAAAKTMLGGTLPYFLLVLPGIAYLLKQLFRIEWPLKFYCPITTYAVTLVGLSIVVFHHQDGQANRIFWAHTMCPIYGIVCALLVSWLVICLPLPRGRFIKHPKKQTT